MKIYTNVEFRLDKEEKEKLGYAQDVLVSIAEFLEDERYKLITGYADNPTYIDAEKLRQLAEDLGDVETAWKVER